MEAEITKVTHDEFTLTNLTSLHTQNVGLDNRCHERVWGDRCSEAVVIGPVDQGNTEFLSLQDLLFYTLFYPK